MAAPPNQWLHEKTINFIARITPHCHDVTRLLSQSMDRRFTATRAIIDTAAFRNLRLVPTVQSATRDHTQVEPFYSVRPGTGLDSIAFRGCSKANERHDKANSAIRRQVAGDFGDNWSVFLDVMILSTARPINYMTRALREHWVEYLLEAAELGLFMVSAGLFTALLEYPASPVH
ncbi:MAG TPA: hypothetical protein VE641_08700, partial [Chthoniobacterales bacterium]|nr:hypothetical protein [Chthoniobacterales bacterium]